MKEQVKKGTHQMMFLNAHGDVTIEWDEEDAEKMEAQIAKLIAEGYQFFIVKNKFLNKVGGMLQNEKSGSLGKGVDSFGKCLEEKSLKKLKKVSQLNENKVVVKDDFIMDCFENIASTKLSSKEEIEDTELDVIKGSTDPKEISESTSVCSQPATAG